MAKRVVSRHRKYSLAEKKWDNLRKKGWNVRVSFNTKRQLWEVITDGKRGKR